MRPAEGISQYLERRRRLAQAMVEGIAVVPTAIPEPSTVVLLGAGLAGMAASRRRRNT